MVATVMVASSGRDSQSRWRESKSLTAIGKVSSKSGPRGRERRAERSQAKVMDDNDRGVLWDAVCGVW